MIESDVQRPELPTMADRKRRLEAFAAIIAAASSGSRDEEAPSSSSEHGSQDNEEAPSAFSGHGSLSSELEEAPTSPLCIGDAPVDPSLLVSYKRHIASKVWEGKAPHRIIRIRNLGPTLHRWNLEEESNSVKAIVERSGLGTLAKYAHQAVDKVLVCAFIERFYPDTNTFHLPFGEMTITPDDVRHILDLPVDGEAMTGDSLGSKNLSKQAAYKLLEETLGLKEVDVENELDSNRSLKLDWIRERFKGSKDGDDEETTKHKARAYLLYLIGCVMCPDKSGNMVRVYHLQILRDLENLQSVCWGNGVLAHLFRELGRASRCGTKSFTGCLTLLQVWIYEHFPSLGRHGYQHGYREPMPRLRKYISTALERGQEKALVALRERIDDLKASEVTWDPYKGQREHYPFQDSAYFSGFLIYFESEQAYYPDRVLRQFGRVQTIPNPTCISIEKSKSTTTSFKPKYRQSLCGWQKRSWRNHLLNTDQRSTPVRDA